MSSGDKPLLGYWPLRGLAQPIRLLLEYTGTDYEERLFDIKGGPGTGLAWPGNWDFSDWTNVKPTLGLDFPNLPYYLDGEVKLSQSTAILRHLARQHGLGGKSDAEMRRIDLVLDQSTDFKMGFARMCYDPEFEKKKVEFITSLPEKLEAFDKFLGAREWFAGDNISFVDFIMFETLDWMRHLHVESVVKCGNLLAFLKRFEKLPKIEEYLKSDRSKMPMFNKMAVWGSKYEERVVHPLEKA